MVSVPYSEEEDVGMLFVVCVRRFLKGWIEDRSEIKWAAGQLFTGR
jgi:hypothetical protein